MKPDFSTITIHTALADEHKKTPIGVEQSAGVAPFTRATKATGNILTAWASHLPSEMKHRIDVAVGHDADVFSQEHVGDDATIIVCTMSENFIENVAYLCVFRTAFALRFDKAPVLAVSVENENSFRALFKLMAAIFGEANILLTSDALMERYLEEEALLHQAIDVLGGAHVMEVATEKFIQQLMA